LILFIFQVIHAAFVIVSDHKFANAFLNILVSFLGLTLETFIV